LKATTVVSNLNQYLNQLPMKRTILLLLFTLAVNLLFSQTFTEQTGISLTGVDLSSVAWGDYDNDGDLDILLTGDKSFNDPISKIYKNNGNNTFTEQTGISLTGVRNSSVAWGDYDNDGDLDILLTGQLETYDHEISKIYKNNGNNTFTEQTGILLPGVYDCSVAWGDYDNDGDLDILLNGNGVSIIYKNNGDNTFTEQTGISLTGVTSSSFAWGDYDNDGDLDILLTGWTGCCGPQISKIFRNNGNNTFTGQTVISLTAVFDGSVAWGDYDNDGDLDILLTGSSNSGPISTIYKNNGNNTFTEQSGISLPGVVLSSAVWGDYDNDGDLDILLTGARNPSGTIRISKIYRNNGNNTFTEQTGISLPGILESSVAWGDYDNDGDLDILLTGNTGTTRISKIYKNEGNIANTCPTAPACSIPVVNKNSVTLSWGKATDAQTPSDGLTYNLYIKRVSDGSLAMSPMSDVSTGFRRIVQQGNVNQILTYTVQNLDYGEYEWYIQAIDNCFSGSVFSKGQNFRISVPLGPTNLAANAISISEVNLTWIDNSNVETGYVVERSVGNNQNFSILATLNSNITTYADSGIAPGTLYYYRVKAFYNEIPSEYSNEAEAQVSFVEQTGISLTGVSSSSVSWGDYDNDGDLDILLTGQAGTSKYISKIYRNNGNNSFTEQTGIKLSGVYVGSVAWGDCDNDGDLDILLTGSAGSYNISKVYKNNGNNTFTEQTAISLEGVSGGSATWGDYDNDGDLDILLTGGSGSYKYSKIYKNNGNNIFTEQTGISLEGVSGGSATWGDYDNDGDLDILLTGYTGSAYISKIYKNNGDNTFTVQTGISLAGVSGGSATWGDYDNDGDLDILLTGYTNDKIFISKIYKNNGNNTFAEQTGILLTGVSGSGAWGDYDNDGDLDILLTGSTGSVNISKIYKNNGNNTFTEQTGISLTGVEYCSVAWGDYDNDGDLDILLTGQAGYSTFVSKIYKNEGIIMNTPPTAPTCSVPNVNKSCVTLSWGKATDAQTPPDWLTYNLYVKRVSDGFLVMSPMSDISSGFCRIVQFGNMNHALSAVINLDCGEYEWYIQAIDNCFSGSVFSKGQNFTTAPLKPTELKAIATSLSEINLIWVDNSKVETGYVVERSIGNNQNFSIIDTLNSNSVNYTDKGLVPGTQYFYRVKALYNDISSEYSNEADAIIIFDEQTGISLPGVSFSSVVWGDYDNDGDLDILLTGNTGSANISKIYKNNGNNTFTEQTSISLTGVSNSSAAWGDYDNDGDLDILLTGNTGSANISKIYKNNGNNTFTEQTGFSLSGVSSGSASWGDYDNDGDLDILLTGLTGSSGISKIYKNNGNNTFTEQTGISLTGVANSSSAWGDYDNDGDLDILLTGESYYGIISKIYKNNGNNTFTDQTGISLTGVSSSSVAWGDYDNDGDLDILLTGSTGSTTRISKIYKNNGNNTFTEQTGISLTGVRNSSVAWGDYDNDGDLDILLTGQAGISNYISKIYKNNSNNTFTEQTSIPLIGIYYSSVAWGDYDNDGDLDFLLTGNTGTTNVSKIYKNESSIANTYPAKPVCSLPIVNKSSVTLSWEKATDAQTPSNGLSYNVYIKKVSDGSLVMSPMSDLTNGFRRVVQPGNMNQILSITQNLDYGEYEWYVQAIDNCFSGSVFSKGQNFKIEIPFSPTKLTANVISGSEINLTWIDNSNGETGYVVERSVGNNQNFSPVAALNSNSTNYTDKGLIPENHYYYRVKALYNDISSEYSNEADIATNFFSEQTGISLTGVSSSSVAWGDYDNDGDLDVLLSGYSKNKSISKIYKNEGNSNFIEQTGISFTDVSSSSVAWGDYDNDGNLDILLTGYISFNKFVSKIYRNNGNNTFTEQTGISLTGVVEGSVAWGDYDNDGDLDILLTGGSTSDNISKIYKNNGDNTFAEQTGISLTGVVFSSVAWGDYDNDGDLDVLLTGSKGSAYISKIYKNNGNSTFTEQTGISLTGVEKGSVAWGDYDNDGDLDILLTGYISFNKFVSKIYRNNGNNTFTEQTGISLSGVTDGSVAWGDCDNDGDLDILLTGSYVSKIYRNNGNNTFTEQTGISLSGVTDGSVAWGDYDNDGDLDILLTGESTSAKISKIYKNQISIANTPPSIPGNIKQTVNNSKVTFTWDKATDNETPQSGLSYNLVVQSNDGKVIKSPLSDLGSGIRKVVSIGNVGQNNSWTIKDLPEGIYYWSVQAIDHSYAGSLFAPTGTFIVGNPVAPDKPVTPKGATNLCLNPSSSEYTTASVPGATSYSWSVSPSNAGVISGDSISGLVDWSDTFYGTAKIAVIAYNKYGESESSDSLTVVINTPPSSIGAISGSQTVCQGTSGNIYKTIPISGAESYVWSLPQGAIGASKSDSINVNFDVSAISGEIKIKGQNSCGTGVESSFAVTVHPKPEKPVVSKSGFTLKSNAENGNQWYKQDELIPGADQQELTSTGDGNYYVIVTEEGCQSDPSDAFIITDIETIVSKGMVDVYPNPVAKNLTIVPVNNNVITYEFIDLLGKLIQKGSISGKTVIETGSFLPGIYLLKINNGKTTEFIKISKE
jgi:predicted nucleotidyltransferase